MKGLYESILAGMKAAKEKHTNSVDNIINRRFFMPEKWIKKFKFPGGFSWLYKKYFQKPLRPVTANIYEILTNDNGISYTKGVEYLLAIVMNTNLDGIEMNSKFNDELSKRITDNIREYYNSDYTDYTRPVGRLGWEDLPPLSCDCNIHKVANYGAKQEEQIPVIFGRIYFHDTDKDDRTWNRIPICMFHLEGKVQ